MGWVVEVDVPSAGSGDGDECVGEASVEFLEVCEGFVSGFGVGDVDVEDEDAGFWAGCYANAVVGEGSGEPVGDLLRVFAGGYGPVLEGGPFFPWSDWDDSPAFGGVVKCCRERGCHAEYLSR